MEHTIRKESGVTIVNLSGEIDVGLATTLRDTLSNLVENQPGPLLINLGDVRYIDSAGLSILIAANRKSKNAGENFGLSNPQIAVKQIFKLTRVDKVLKIFPTVEEGIAKLRNGA